MTWPDQYQCAGPQGQSQATGHGARYSARLGHETLTRLRDLIPTNRKSNSIVTEFDSDWTRNSVSDSRETSSRPFRNRTRSSPSSTQKGHGSLYATASLSLSRRLASCYASQHLPSFSTSGGGVAHLGVDKSPSLRLSLNESQCGSCSSKYNTSAGT